MIVDIMARIMIGLVIEKVSFIEIKGAELFGPKIVHIKNRVEYDDVRPAPRIIIEIAKILLGINIDTSMIRSFE